MGDPADGAVEGECDTLRSRCGAWIEVDQRHVQRRMSARLRQPFAGRGIELHRQRQARAVLVRQPEHAEAPQLKHSGEAERRPRDPVFNVHPVVCHQYETVVKQSQHQVRLPGPGCAQQQHAGVVACRAARMNLHGAGTWRVPAYKPSVLFTRPCGHLARTLLACQRRPMETTILPSRADIDAAAVRIGRHVRHTPLLRLGEGDLDLGYPVTLKLELLQHAGSFKPRGAFNRILSEQAAGGLPKAGVIAASGGNHGAAVAYAARALGLTAEIFVPELTPATKRARIEAYGARLVRGGATYAEALVASRLRVAETGAMEVHAYDHPAVLAGQGTTAREFEGDAPELTHVLVATGGGGLIGGMAAWYSGRTQVISVEPAACPALHDAIRAGAPVEAPVGGVAADALGARQVGALMFPIAQAYVAAAVLVTDDAIRAAQRLLWERFHLIAEPGGATALAALISGAWAPPPAARVGVLVCGSNTDPASVMA